MSIVVGEHAITCVDLPGHPVGMCGEVKEVGRRFVLLEFEDGHQAYYLACQLDVPPPESSGPKTD